MLALGVHSYFSSKCKLVLLVTKTVHKTALASLALDGMFVGGAIAESLPYIWLVQTATPPHIQLAVFKRSNACRTAKTTIFHVSLE